MLPQQGRLDVPGGQQGVLHHRHIGGIEHPFELVAVIEPLGQPENVEIGICRKGRVMVICENPKHKQRQG